MTMAMRIERALRMTWGAVALAAILVGVPVLLWFLTRPLLERDRPAGRTVTDLLLGPDDGTLLMTLLAGLGAIAWAVLAASICIEIVANVTGRPARHIDLPGFRLGRTIAAALVATVLGASPAVAAVSGPVPSGLLAVTAPAVPRTDPSPTPVHVVAPRDTLWHIAETALGDPLRWREIYALNVGRVQADGERLTEASSLVVGWRLVLPDDARRTVQVRPGDTLSELASEHLGDPGRSDDIFALNRLAPQPDGATVDDPDLLRPGWTLVLPEPPPVQATPPPTSGPTAPTVPPAPQPTAAPPDVDATASPGSDTHPEPATEPPRPVNEPDSDEDASDGSNWLVSLGVPSIVAGGVLAALAVRRRRQLRHRPFRHRIAVPTDDDGRLEWALAHPTTRTAGTLPAARHLDLALRAMARDVDPSGSPAIGLVRLSESDALLTTVGDGRLALPFRPAGDGLWSLSSDEHLPGSAAEISGLAAPFPLLVSIATDVDGDAERTLLIDLEHRRVLRIGGDPTACEAFIRHLAAELATSGMAEDTEVLLVGLGTDIAVLNSDRLVAADLEDALAEIERRAASVRAALDHWQLDSVVRGRLDGVAADSWLPLVLLSTREPGPEQRNRLQKLVESAGGVGVVIVDQGDPDLRIGAGGHIDLPGVEDGPWRAARLTARAGTHLVALLGTTDRPAERPAAAPPPDLWAEDMDEDGGHAPPVPGETATDEAVPPPAPAHDPVADDDMIELGPDVAAGTARPDAVVDDEALRRLAIVDHQDPALDRDLSLWLEPGTPPVPLIAILGEPIVRAPGPVPAVRPSWFAEVLVYLSLNPGGVTPAKAVTDLWPEGQRVSPATTRHAFYGARRWAGRGLNGDPGLTFVSDLQHDNTYRLRGHLLDWDLFRRLRKRAHARQAAAHPGAVDDYRAALALIRGPVLAALRPGGYAWLNNHDQRHDLQIPGFLVDTAHELVEIALAAGDTAVARWAAEQARTVDIDVVFDRPLIDLMRVAHAEDNRAELEMHAAVLLDARGFDVPEELAPESFAVLNDLLPAGPRRPRS